MVGDLMNAESPYVKRPNGQGRSDMIDELDSVFPLEEEG